MFERYTEKARRTIFFSRYEASQFGSPYIESQHLLLGVLREDKALADTFLHTHGGVESIRKQIEEHTAIREKVSTSVVDLPFTNECKRILSYAAEEAEKLSHKNIGTGHLFLGVLREQDCFAATLLGERGIRLAMAREWIVSSPRPPGLPLLYTSHKLLYNSAAETLILELLANPPFLEATRLFTRHKDKKAYEQIGSPAESVSFESPVTCQSLPLVVFNSFKRGKQSGDWEGVYSFNLHTKELEVCISRQKLQLSEGHGQFWIVELVSLSEDARTLYVNLGVEKIASDEVFPYHLAKVDLADQTATLLSPLLYTRF